MNRSPLLLLAICGAFFFAVASAEAHVRLIAPNGGEVFEVGETVEIEWTIVIAHGQLNWDLWYSTNGTSGPWTSIAVNLPAGSSSVGSLHSYLWTVPDVVDDSVWVRVRMDNAGTDYFDVSDQPFVIASDCPADVSGDSVVGFGDLLTVLGAWGEIGGPADIDGSGAVDFGDLLMLLGAWGAC